jgi:hypothetical protein
MVQLVLVGSHNRWNRIEHPCLAQNNVHPSGKGDCSMFPTITRRLNIVPVLAESTAVWAANFRRATPEAISTGTIASFSR